MQSPDQASVNAALGILALMPILATIIVAIVLLPVWFICKKAGFSPWLSLLVVVPFGGLVLLYMLAFSDWKVVPVSQATRMPPNYPTSNYPPTNYPPPSPG